jgi:hypothetical protein
MGLLAATLSIAAAAGATPARPDRLPPELERVRRALDTYQDPIVALHDGDFSTIGCVAGDRRQVMPARTGCPRCGDIATSSSCDA